jgi:Galactose oxidase, central domain
MKHVLKIFSSAMLLSLCLILVACSGIPGGANNGGGGGTTGPFTISVAVTGLAGAGLVFADNVTDKLPVAANGTFPFATTITSGAVYSVSVVTQPSNPAQVCIVPQGSSGTATANVTISITCTTGALTIGGQVNGLQGSGLVLQNSSATGVDKLTITAPGPFTFLNPVATNGAYSVTVLTQPATPTQTCIVANGAGNAANNIGNIVVTCSVGTISIGGSVSGLDGTGLTLLDNGGDMITIAGNGSFSFPTLLVAGAPFTITFGAQPTAPGQTCGFTTGTDTGVATTPSITNIQVVCPPVFEPISAQVVGLSIPFGETSQMVLQNNGGDNLPASGNGVFPFTTPIAYGSGYDVDVFVAPGTQTQGYIRWNYQGKAITPVTDVTIDWGHNDWAWLNGANTSNQNGAYAAVVQPITTFVSNSPGGRKYAATWTDAAGHLWLFGGYGYTYNTQVGPQPFFLDEMWVYYGSQDYFGGFNDYWDLISPLPSPAPVLLTPSPRYGSISWTDPNTGHLMLFGGQQVGLSFMNDIWEFKPVGVQLSGTWTNHNVGGADMNGVYGTQGVGSTSNLPGGRWGATSRLDSSGNLWVFGGFGYDATSRTPGLLNDLWEYNTSNGQWTWVAGSNQINQDGIYGTVGTPGGGPGGRQAMVSWLDNAGNFWIFGGYNLSGLGQPNSFNDLWKFSGGQWTWVSGANTVNQVGIYGTQGVSASTNVPGARWSPAAWTDKQGNFWLYGGQGYDLAGNGSLADLWAYNPNAPAVPADPNPYLPASAQWVWVKGPNSVSQPGQYGLDPSTEFGTFWPHVTNHPSSRYATSYWYQTDPFGQSQFFMFGGEGFDSTTSNNNGLLNDLERYLPYP